MSSIINITRGSAIELHHQDLNHDKPSPCMSEDIPRRMIMVSGLCVRRWHVAEVGNRLRLQALRLLPAPKEEPQGSSDHHQTTDAHPNSNADLPTGTESWACRCSTLVTPVVLVLYGRSHRLLQGPAVERDGGLDFYRPRDIQVGKFDAKKVCWYVYLQAMERDQGTYLVKLPYNSTAPTCSKGRVRSSCSVVLSRNELVIMFFMLGMEKLKSCQSVGLCAELVCFTPGSHHLYRYPY